MDKDYLSKRYMLCPRTNWKNFGTRSSKTKNADGYEKPTLTEDLLSCSAKRKTENFDSALTTEHSTTSPRKTDTPYP